MTVSRSGSQTRLSSCTPSLRSVDRLAPTLHTSSFHEHAGSGSHRTPKVAGRARRALAPKHETTPTIWSRVPEIYWPTSPKSGGVTVRPPPCPIEQASRLGNDHARSRGPAARGASGGLVSRVQGSEIVRTNRSRRGGASDGIRSVEEGGINQRDGGRIATSSPTIVPPARSTRAAVRGPQADRASAGPPISRR